MEAGADGSGSLGCQVQPGRPAAKCAACWPVPLAISSARPRAGRRLRSAASKGSRLRSAAGLWRACVSSGGKGVGFVRAILGPQFRPFADRHPPMARIRVTHKTLYRYSEPVQLRRTPFHVPPARQPRPAADRHRHQRSAPPATLRWIHDVFGNSVCGRNVRRHRRRTALRIELRRRTFSGRPRRVDLIEPYAETLPFSYDASEMPDLARAARAPLRRPRAPRSTPGCARCCDAAGTDNTLDSAGRHDTRHQGAVRLRGARRRRHADAGADADSWAAAAAATLRCS